MNTSLLYIILYGVAALALSAIDITLGILAYKRHAIETKWYIVTAFLCAVTSISYYFSIITIKYAAMSIFSAIYFISITLMLLSMLYYTFVLTHIRLSKLQRCIFGIFAGFSTADIIIEAINPIKEISVHFKLRDLVIGHYDYEMKPLYYFHLIVTYSMVIMVIALLLYHMLKMPCRYRKPFRIVLFGIGAVVLINAVFLYIPGNNALTELDYSLVGYSFVLCIIYWSNYFYRYNDMLNSFKTDIFDNISQGILLFDFENVLLLHNQKADKMFGEKVLNQDLHIRQFLDMIQSPIKIDSDIEKYTSQVYKLDDKNAPLRCDYNVLKDKNNRVIGRLLTFTDERLDKDLLTNFQARDAFRTYVRNNPMEFTPPTTVSVLDINSLSNINNTLGRTEGDRLIRKLADIMVQVFPQDTNFVRGNEANLIAVCRGLTENTVNQLLNKVREQFVEKIQFAICTTSNEMSDVLEALQIASRGLKTKKLMDSESMHSESLSSLVKALEECDSDTEEHVQRTRIMGACLGKRIGLTDVQLTELSLLCLLHDIGKIGIPLEILNKPGKLTEEEWVIMRSHVEKGYQIAHSSHGLDCIADMILHHHERWDGKGYPDNLVGDQTPILARIISVVDAYDAMINDRVYRKAMPIEEAQEELNRCAGTQFDPYIVKEFLAMLRENPENFQQNSIIIQKEKKKTTASVKISSELSHVHPLKFSSYILDEDSRIIEIDDMFTTITGYTMEDVIQDAMTQMDLIPEEDAMEYGVLLTEYLNMNKLVYFEHRIKKKNDEVIYVLCMGNIYTDEVTKKQYSKVFITNSMDTVAMRQLSDTEKTNPQLRLQRWENQYRRDSLTGLLSLNAYKTDVDRKLVTGEYKILMINISMDHFRQYCMKHGRENGDRLIRCVGDSLKKILREGDLSTRIEGDIFGASLFFMPEHEEAMLYRRGSQIMEQIRQNLSKLDPNFTISAGASISDDNISTFSQLMDEANRQMLIAKTDKSVQLHHK